MTKTMFATAALISFGGIAHASESWLGNFIAPGWPTTPNDPVPWNIPFEPYVPFSTEYPGEEPYLLYRGSNGGNKLRLIDMTPIWNVPVGEDQELYVDNSQELVYTEQCDPLSISYVGLLDQRTKPIYPRNIEYATCALKVTQGQSQQITATSGFFAHFRSVSPNSRDAPAPLYGLNVNGDLVARAKSYTSRVFESESGEYYGYLKVVHVPAMWDSATLPGRYRADNLLHYQLFVTKGEYEQIAFYITDDPSSETGKSDFHSVLSDSPTSTATDIFYAMWDTTTDADLNTDINWDSFDFADAQAVFDRAVATAPAPPPSPSSREYFWAIDGCGQQQQKRSEACIEASTELAVRCCPISGAGAGSVCIRATRDTAETICALRGGRICWKGELVNGNQCGTGCNWDRELVWARDDCRRADASPPPSPPFVRHWVAVDGCGAAGTKTEVCEPETAQHGIRCCGPQGSDAAGSVCVLGTQPIASSMCEARGGVLCWASSLFYGKQCRTGCFHDARLVWSRTRCNPEEFTPRSR